MSLQEPPTTEVMIDQDGRPSLAWLLFFNQFPIGDTGEVWEPTFDGLTEVGGDATITGRFFKLSQEIVYFHIHIVPATNTSATAGTTFVDNFPLNVTRNGVCFAVTGNLGSNSGIVQEGTNKIYVPGWTTVTNPLTIVGIAEAK